MDAHGFYSRQYSADELQQMSRQHQQNAHDMMDMMAPGAPSGPGIMGAQSLDDIVNQNESELRRRSMPIAYGNGQNELDSTMRRVSMMDMMEFGGVGATYSSSRGLDGFQFNPATPGFDQTMSGVDESQSVNEPSQTQTTPSHGLSISTHFPSQSTYNSMSQQDTMYAPSMQVNTPLDMSLNSPYMTSGLPMSADIGMMGSDLPTSDKYGNPQYGSPYAESSPAHQGYISSMVPTPQTTENASLRTESLPQSTENSATPASSHPSVRNISRANSQDNKSQTNSKADSTSAQTGNMGPPQPTIRPYSPKPVAANSGPQESINGNTLPWAPPANGWPSTMVGRPHTSTKYKDAYAPSGYDLLSILMRVTARPNPTINIGSVDLSCAFVVCNAQQHDKPIEFCSESFERLTGYTKHEIRGQNCRFLQAPNGKVEPGLQRKYCDDTSVFYLKRCINDAEEAQISLINYRKGGQPFMNLLTMIPLKDDQGLVTHFVGFQVDLVENPQAINARNADGTLSIAYQRSAGLPSYFISQPEASMMTEFSQGHTLVPRDEVSSVLGTMGSSDTELSRRLMDKVLLENADDVIHVLSLKGIFLYLSHSCRKVLEYEAAELVGTPLSAVCHPSDIVPVTRELKDGSNGSSVNVVFRIRRKNSGYVWFESHGSLLTDQGKGRKCVILVGRERPVYTLSKHILLRGGGIGDNEMWAKMSTTGMFLYISSTVRSLLDRQPEDLIGTNIQSLMRQDSKEEFGRILRVALTGQNTSVRHEITNKRGQVLQAFTWIYPGDATEGHKPTFLLAQIRLIRYQRGGGHKGGSISKGDRASNSLFSTPSRLQGSGTPMSTATTGTADTTKYRTPQDHPVSRAGHSGLLLGNQHESLASDENVFDELKTTRSTSWQFELRQMERRNRVLAEEVQSLIASKKKRKRRRGAGALQKDCANCHTKHTPEWRRGPSGQRDLCNSCGLRWAKQNGRVSPRDSQPSARSTKSTQSDNRSKPSGSPASTRLGNDPTGNNDIPSASPAEKRASAQEASMLSHAAKVARMEAPAHQGRSSGVPRSIDEGIEP
ncbi:white collar [Venturia nashicola]|uniref:White collar n=1 Tax=Venturia nashicola TaxID=86259 RepID=A0A4Z1P2I5_9PEZI|nr:white collar [Venturia nashicola]TLD19406.1 white collar [Venturia nashicola]